MRATSSLITCIMMLVFGCSDDTKKDVPNRDLPPTFFGLDGQFDLSATEAPVPWPNDVGFGAHQLARAWLGGGGLWADIHRNGRGASFQWEAVDGYVQKAAQYNQKVLYVVAMTPAFAVEPNHRSSLCAWPDLYPGGCNPPDDWDDGAQGVCLPPADQYQGPNCTYKEFLVALVRRYRGSGIQASCTHSEPQCHGVIHYYELGNEVDSFNWPDTRFWAGTAAGTGTDTAANALAVLARMVKDGAQVIRREDPSARVVAPSFTGHEGAGYFEQFFGRPSSPLEDVDIVSFHGYPETHAEHAPEAVREVTQGYLDAMQRLAQEHPEALQRPLWDTEGGWGWNFGGPCLHGEDNPCIHEVWKQTAYLTRWFLHQWDLGVESAVWFSWGVNGWGELWCPEGNTSEDHHIGCEQLDDNEPQVNRAGTAYVELSKWLTGARRSSPCERSGSVWMCPIERADLTGGRGVIVWHEDWHNFDSVYSIPNEFTQSWHLDGAAGPVTSEEVPVFSVPVLYH